VYGVTAFTPIINTPQAAHLAIGAVTPRPAVHGGEVTVRHLMSATLVCDHRVLYGAEAAQLLARIRELLERPAAMYL
jgi:pyruvate dehydrogenase E2 component (dihydrolipoamide acetyltransferase)